MEYTTPTEQQYGKAMSALEQAEIILCNPDSSSENLLGLRRILADENDGMRLLRMQEKLKQRLEEVLARVIPTETEEQCVVVSSAYKGTRFEMKAPIYPACPEKRLFNYGLGLLDINKRKLQRFPLPSEVFPLIIAGVEGKLHGDLKAVYEDINFSYAEWFGMAVERKGNLLIAYINPKGLMHDGNKYAKKDFSYDYEMRLKIADNPSQLYYPECGFNPLHCFSDEFVRAFYDRSFKELPKQMKEGTFMASFYLPAEGAVWPIAMKDYFGIDCPQHAAIRGIRKE